VRNHDKAAIGVVLLSMAMLARAQSPFDAIKSFSATYVMSGMSARAGQAQTEAKIYRLGDQIRTTLPGGMGYSIVDMNTHTSYMVMRGMCMQMAAQGLENPLAHSRDAAIERTPAGADTVDGHVCKVEDLTITPRSGPRAGQPAKVKVWEAQDLNGFPIKTETQTAQGTITMQYKDISLAAPDASLFAHPDNCRQMPVMPAGAAPH
jgi:hypothetical protein